MDLERLTRFFRLREGWLMVGLVALMLFSVTWSVQRADWAAGLRILSPVTLVGLLAGLVLCKIQGVPRALLHAVGAVTGAITTLWLTANLIENPYIPTIQDKTQTLLDKTMTWFGAVVAGDMSDDIWVFILALAVLCYALAYASVWFLFRSRWLWWALVPNGIALLVNLSYTSTPGLQIFFILYMISALLLMVRFNMLQHEERWDRERVNYSPNLRWSFLWVSSLFAGAVAVSMWYVPPQAVNSTLNAAWERVNGPWVELQLRFSRAFSGVNGGGNFGYSSFNSSFALGGSLNLGDSIALRVKSDRPLYWRAMTYDTWNGIGWQNTAEATLRRNSVSSKLSLDANQQLLSEDAYRQPVTLTITLVQPKGPVLLAPQRPVKAGLPTRLDVSWEDKTVTYRIPGDDPGATELELRPLLTHFAEARRLGMERSNSDGWMPEAGDTDHTRLILEELGKAGDIISEIAKLSDRGINVQYRLEENLTFVVQADGPFPQYEDITAIYSHDPLERGEQYTLVSEPSVAPAQVLREAGTDYPAWVNRYLQLPGSLPPRVGELARNIVAEAGATNAYDMAVALRDYLRANYKYNTKIPMPPPGVDRVDYFLFNGKEGYCEYFSSAMVVMLRVLNVPVREAVGYAPGEPDAASGEYVVRESSSHAWPEVYFPRYGWIEFEPTPSQAVISRPETDRPPGVQPSPSVPYDPIDVSERDPDPFNDPTPQAGGLTGGFAGFLDSNGPGAIGGGLALFGVVAFGFIWLLRRRARQRALAAGITTASGATYYERLLRLAWWAGLRPQPSATPFEFAEVVGQEVPTSRPYVRSIVRAYVHERFGRRKLSVVDQIQLERAWGEVRRGLLHRMSNARQVWTRLRTRARFRRP